MKVKSKKMRNPKSIPGSIIRIISGSLIGISILSTAACSSRDPQLLGEEPAIPIEEDDNNDFNNDEIDTETLRGEIIVEPGELDEPPKENNTNNE